MTTGIPQTLARLAVPTDQLVPYGRNPRRGNVELIAESLQHHGQYKPIVVRTGTNEVLAGNHTLRAAQQLGWTEIAATFVDVDDDTAARIVLIDNRSNDVAGYDDEALQELLSSLPDLAGTGFSVEDLDSYTAGVEEASQTSSLVERFGLPPFTVLDARSGAWQRRKAAWKGLGIESELGRDDDLLWTSPQTLYANWYEVKNAAEKEAGRELTGEEILEARREELVEFSSSGTSIFDPVLTELLYRWFSPPGGHVLDPWAGGSVRGVVAARLGRRYTGIELREEQVHANRDQVGLTNGPLPAQLAAAPGMSDREPDLITDEPVENPEPYWIVGESSEQLAELPREEYDFIIGCPPYYDLEVYSDDPRDMSNLAPAEFDRAMIENVKRAAERLKPDSFVAFIVGAVRNNRGALMDMRSLMVRAAGEAGLTLHNDAILVTSVGTAAARAARPFQATRVLARTHQDVLIFLKGDRKRASVKCSDTEAEATLEALNEAAEAAITEEDN